MLKNILIVGRKLASAALNFLIVYFETIALPHELGAGRHHHVHHVHRAVQHLQRRGLPAGGAVAAGLRFHWAELPLWLKRLKFISTSCLAMTFLTVVIILAPMYEDGNGWYIMLFTGSMLYHHFPQPGAGHPVAGALRASPRLSLGQVWWALVPTVLYGLYDLHGNITGTIDGPLSLYAGV